MRWQEAESPSFKASPWPPSCSRHPERGLPGFALTPLESQVLVKSTRRARCCCRQSVVIIIHNKPLGREVLSAAGEMQSYGRPRAGHTCGRAQGRCRQRVPCCLRAGRAENRAQLFPSRWEIRWKLTSGRPSPR